MCGLCNSGIFHALSSSVGKLYNRLSIVRLILNFQENEKIAKFQTFPDVCHSAHCHYTALCQWYAARCCDAIKDNQMSDSFYCSLLCNDSCSVCEVNKLQTCTNAAFLANLLCWGNNFKTNNDNNKKDMWIISRVFTSITYNIFIHKVIWLITQSLGLGLLMIKKGSSDEGNNLSIFSSRSMVQNDLWANFLILWNQFLTLFLFFSQWANRDLMQNALKYPLWKRESNFQEG